MPAQPDHRDAIAALPPAERDRLRQRLNGPGLFRLAVHGGAVMLLGALIVAKVPLWPLLLLAQGVALVFLFSLMHETVHRTAFASGWINRLVAPICGLVLLLPSVWFRYFHLAHHRHTQDRSRDPELATPRPATLGSYAWHVSGLPLWRSLLETLWRNARGRCADDFVPVSARGAVRRESRAMIAIYLAVLGASIVAGSGAALHAWVIPALLGQPFLRLFLLAEHGQRPEVANMLENSRTTLTHPLVRLLSWNMSYHSEHHADPSVPFHRLPALHRAIRDRLVDTERGYLRFHRRYVAALLAAGRRCDAGGAV